MNLEVKPFFESVGIPEGTIQPNDIGDLPYGVARKLAKTDAEIITNIHRFFIEARHKFSKKVAKTAIINK